LAHSSISKDICKIPDQDGKYLEEIIGLPKTTSEPAVPAPTPTPAPKVLWSAIYQWEDKPEQQEYASIITRSGEHLVGISKKGKSAIALQQAVLQGDSELFCPLLEQLSSENSSLAIAIQERLDNFEYDKILNLIATQKPETPSKS
jgi:hypothetical protein